VLLISLLVLIVLALSGAGYANYRINRFTESVFRPESTPPHTEFGETPTPAVLAAEATNTPTLAPPTPTHDPTDPNTPTPAPTPTETPIPQSPTPTPLPVGNSPVIQRIRAGERVTVLMLGFGGPGHDGGYLTDSIQVMSFDPQTSTATLISVPRDLWVLIPAYQGRGGYWGKINEAYTVGMGPVGRDDQNIPWSKHDAGGQLAMKTVAQVLGIPIDYWVSLDFVGFRQFIDALGGVDVNVEKAFTDDHYPENDNADLDPNYKTVHFDAGLQHMNGEQAIEYSRSRYSPEDGTDFGRARRQQVLMSAVKEQIFSVETIPKVFGLLDALQGHLRMSFSFSEAKDLAGWAQGQIRDKQQFTIHSTVLQTGPLLYSSTSAGGAYIILPTAGQGNYNQIHAFVQSELRGTASGTPGALGTPGRGPATPTTTATP
jgi:polyisoprenyl-teichoic acid--peptidoglycan teichoic acid transferase